MQSTSNLALLIPDSLTKFAYQAFQDGKKAFGVAHKTISDSLTDLALPDKRDRTQPLSPETLLKLQNQSKQLEETDWKDSQAGVYPSQVLFDNPWQDFFRYYPEVWLDMPKIWSRIQAKEYQAFDSKIDREGYPSYYLQNFHYQTDGYLSDLSANLYDLQVEILFNGSADAMRRRILKPLKEGLQAFTDVLPQQTRILDVACGTGRTLRMIRAAFDKAKLFGTDLSPAYLRKANQLLSEIPGELPQLLQANGEDLPYLDNYFHGVSSVFLFHELPPNARQAIIEECFRVLQPGGTFVICDSMQEVDAPDFQVMMSNFPVLFHEPYYRSYTTDNIEERLEKAGFTNVKIENHFVSKYWVATKPAV
ncbi:Type 11 methyltransferase [Hyella patelloides LEGE 07179]|uniref:Type 11 methyltransferase n=1 Tax=Hyella patelloides LEGE 07179 TaxID=945734 RepID=A0A563W4B6_9CYAN|nr:class I SAM-dependent methyltransferase [Hyella patelloides]VEP18524.1 Type 11 methyltransferase [Hyella patelloides LEGE 07179]